MTYGEYKKTDEYLNAQDVTVCVNGEDEIDEMYYPDELDFLPVVGVGYDATGIKIDLVCSNWDKRFDVGWIGESEDNMTINNIDNISSCSDEELKVLAQQVLRLNERGVTDEQPLRHLIDAAGFSNAVLLVSTEIFIECTKRWVNWKEEK